MQVYTIDLKEGLARARELLRRGRNEEAEACIEELAERFPGAEELAHILEHMRIHLGGGPVPKTPVRASTGGDPDLFAPDLHRKAVVWYSTMKCNNRCPYCLAFQVDDPMIKVPFREWREWADVWNRFEGELLLDITGGEPFLVPGMVDLINGLNDSIKVAVTTNTRCDLTRFVQEVSPEKCISVTASLHPSAPANTEQFLGKILLLKNRGFRVIVNFVAYPEQLWMIPWFKEQVEGCGVPFHVDPYGPGPKRPYTLSSEEEAFLRRYVGADRSDFFNHEPVLYCCSGGMNFLSVLPDGSAYTCVTKRYVKENFVGNVFDEAFRLFEKPIRCKAVSCAGCDLDKVTRIPADRVRFPEGGPS